MVSGILLVNKPRGVSSFSLVRRLRKLLGVRKIGHAGTLDPFATGVMVMLIGRDYTRLSDSFLNQDKEYIARLHLGETTDTFDCDGSTLVTSAYLPTSKEIEKTLAKFQGTIDQLPPMYSAKKINGKKLYTLARAGKTVERSPHPVHVKIDVLAYHYPHLDIHVTCSKGTYIRSLADEIGQVLTCGAHLSRLQRSRSGAFTLSKCIDGNLLNANNIDAIEQHMFHTHNENR